MSKPRVEPSLSLPCKICGASTAQSDQVCLACNGRFTGTFGVEPSVSEPARCEFCPMRIWRDSAGEWVHMESGLPTCSFAKETVATPRVEPVIAPQPTPPTQTCSECSLVFGKKHHLVHCASATCPILDRLIAEVAPQPKPEPHYETTDCLHDFGAYNIGTPPKAAPQGVGKLQLTIEEALQEIADRDGIIRGLQDALAGRVRPLAEIEQEIAGRGDVASDGSRKEARAVAGADDSHNNATELATPPLRNERPAVEPKAVEVIGQAGESPTYEAIANAGPEFYVESGELACTLRSRSLSLELYGLANTKSRRAILEDLAQTLNHIVAINQQHFAARETLTLRAELQHNQKLLGQRIGRIGYLLSCIKEFDERAYQYLANRLTPEEIEFSKLPELVAELRSRLQEGREVRGMSSKEEQIASLQSELAQLNQRLEMIAEGELGEALLIYKARAEKAESELEAWRQWRTGLLDCWANDHRATMTAMLEGGPANSEGLGGE